jgi:Bacterial Ig-like domain
LKLKKILFFIGFILCGCAQVRTPIGGEKDIDPPVLVKIIPENFSTQFNEKKIIVEFNEYLKPNDLGNQLVISPPFKEKPTVLIKGRKVEITLKDTLAQNTTYNFNFGNSIQDLTEANTLEDFVYVFSTGTYIDSLEFAGTIKDAFTSSTEKGIVAMLYNSFEDSVISTTTPNYFAKTKEDGSFKIKYIKAGRYKMIALKDESNNFLYDFPIEYLAFTPDSIIPSVLDSADILPHFELYKEKDTTQYIKETIAKSYGFIQFIFNIPNKNFRVEPANFSFKNNPWNIQQIGSKKDTVSIWIPDLEGKEDLDLVVFDGNTVIDTVNWFIGKSDKEREQPKLRTGRKFAGYINNPESAIINFNYPIQLTDFSLMHLMEDTLEVKFNVTPIDSLKKNYRIIYPFQTGKKYEATLLPGSFTDLYNTTIDTTKIGYKLHDPEYFGTVSIKFSFADSIPKQYIFQMLTEKLDVIREVTIDSSNMVVLKELSPVKCRFRIIVDANKNNIWDTGNYLKKIQPEKVIYYPETTDVRSNWDVELDWVVK